MSDLLVTSPEDVRENIAQFSAELAGNPALARVLGYTRAWYAMRNSAGQWVFGPSKFIGYRGNTARHYLKTNRSGHHGWRSEHVLRQWFYPVKAGTPLHEELFGKLQALFETAGKRPNQKLRINVFKGDLNEAPRNVSRADSERITIRPDVCGGRPCIRGMRIRVSDILDLLAAGEDRAQILSEYPYLESEDIDAALAYAARSVDHRVIEAA